MPFLVLRTSHVITVRRKKPTKRTGKKKLAKCLCSVFSSCYYGNQVMVQRTHGHFPTGVHNKPRESVVLFIWMKREVHTVSPPLLFLLQLPCFLLTVFVSVSVPSPQVSSSSLHLHDQAGVPSVLHRKRCCFKPTVMSAFLWRKSNKL